MLVLLDTTNELKAELLHSLNGLSPLRQEQFTISLSLSYLIGRYEHDLGLRAKSRNGVSKCTGKRLLVLLTHQGNWGGWQDPT